ncbi:hypothetical protein CN934_13040 [Ensifer sp. MMN_5]|nr:hypothetical protein CN934_13040 [Ensifer sp. MMN_5]PND26538.1 hypothetical protein CN933_16505 [Sinorhizobium sp. M4_45]
MNCVRAFPSPGRRDLPLTLTLSPRAGRGDVATETPAVMVANAATASPFSPPAGRRCRQADEGHGETADTAPEARDIEDM